jgi:effector-binding domain-containing protein
MVYDVDIVAIPEQAVLALRERGPLSDLGRRMRRLRGLVAQAGLEPAGPVMARFYEDEADSAALDFDVCMPVEPGHDGAVPDAVGEARGEWIPLHHVLQVVHHGPHDTVRDAWRALREAREALGYTAAGPLTEVFILDRDSGVEPAAFVTEIRQPYAR